MINVQNLAVLLRALRQGEPSSRAPGAARPVAGIAPVLALAAEDGSAAALRAATDHLADGTDRARARVPAEQAGVGRNERATAPLPDAALPRALDAARAASAGTTVALSAGGALLGEMLATADDAPAATIRAARPLVGHDGDGGPGLADALQRSVRHSGMFYEAHLARWSHEAYPTAELVMEPQAAWSAPSGTDIDAAAGAPVHGEGTRADPAAMVRQQLDALETGRFAWMGEIWPRQSGTITFEDLTHAADPDGSGAPPEEGTCSSRIELDLPVLGRVAAVISVRGQGVSCRITAATETGRRRLDAAGPDLATALSDRALALASFTVEHA